ncbi:hypothetical protein PG994_012011 [Apiospora phragmitis]|uniref:Phosphatidylethanolamine-binding protein n=1 Tax=Apiospora phragmitis TaxID=2905665 RepID=A0ABR1TUF7_9PEZI
MASPEETLQAHADALLASLRSACLVPGPAATLLPAADWRPTMQLRVAFGRKQVELGTFFRAGECKELKPVVEVPHLASTPPSSTAAAGADAAEAATTTTEPKKRRTRYTFLMIDSDAPTPEDPKFAFWRHWVVSGLSLGEEKEDEEGAAGEAGGDWDRNEVTDSKPHRYLFLLYQEPDGMRTLSKADVGGDEFVQRRSFDAATFATRHGLTLVGMNWMTCAGDGWTG